MEEETEHLTKSHIISAILVFAFVWGALWAGSEGIDIALYSGEGKNGKVVSQTANSSSVALTAVVVSSSSPAAIVIPATNVPSSLTVLVGGDVMMDRGVRVIAQRNGYDSLFATVTPMFKAADIVVVNLEGPITSSSSKTLLANGTLTKALSFTFAPESAQALADAGVTAVSLANNHTDNFGASGFAETKAHLANVGVEWFGDPWNSSSTEAVIAKNGIKVALVGYYGFTSGFDRVISSVQRLSSVGDIVIVMPHWGEEYSNHPSDKMRAQASALVKAGASAIIGSHPHVIEDHELIGGVPVFYSVGNLLFDQYFSSEVIKGDIIELQLVKNSNGISLSSVKVQETSTASRSGIDLVGESQVIR